MLAYSEEVNSLKVHWATLKDDEEKANYSRQRKELKAAVEDVSISDSFIDPPALIIYGIASSPLECLVAPTTLG